MFVPLPAQRELLASLEAERALLRRAIGVVSDLSRLETEIAAVLDAFAKLGPAPR